MNTTLVQRPRLRRRARRAAAGALLVAVLPIAGCGGSSSADGSTDADPAAVVPATSAFYGELTVRPEGDLKASVEALAKKIAKTDDPGAKIIALLDDSLKDGKASFKDDIEPWLGKKVGVAITGLKHPQSPDYAIVLAATDTKKALDSLKKGESGLVERKYKDVTYTYNKSEQQAAAAIGDTLTVGTEAALKSVIDVEKGGASLADSDKLKQARKSVTADGLGFFYLDPVAIIDLVASASPELGSQAGPLKSLLGGANASALGAALTTTADAIRLETAVDGQPAGKNAGDAAATLAGLPTGSVLAVGFGDIGSAAQKGVGQIGQLGGIYAGVLSQFRTITGLDLQQDVLSWMGNGGLFLRAKGITDLGGALVVDTSSEQKTTEFIAAARRLVIQFGAGAGLSVKPFSGSGAKGFQVADALPFPIIVATGGGKFVVAAGEASVAEALKPTTTLGEDPQFKATAAKLGVKPQLYVDLQTIVGFLGLAVGDDPSFKKAKPYLESFTALAAGSEQAGGTTKSSLVVVVK